MVIDSVGPGNGRAVCLDPDGRARLDGLAAGRYVAKLREAGLVAVSAAVEVSANGVAPVDLVEPEGGTVDVVLVDADGRPLPFGTFSVDLPSGLTWLDVDDDGAQRIDVFTDAAGRRVLGHVESGEVEVYASWASRTAKTTVTVVDGGRAAARLVLDAPEDR